MTWRIRADVFAGNVKLAGDCDMIVPERCVEELMELLSRHLGAETRAVRK